MEGPDCNLLAAIASRSTGDIRHPINRKQEGTTVRSFNLQRLSLRFEALRFRMTGRARGEGTSRRSAIVLEMNRRWPQMAAETDSLLRPSAVKRTFQARRQLEKQNGRPPIREKRPNLLSRLGV
jgi:hypothetical protein